MSDIGDEELRRHFEALRDVDLAQTPSFATLSRPPMQRRPASRVAARWVLAGGVGAMAAATMLAVLSHRRQEDALLRAATEISRWQAPTDALLDGSHGALLGGATVLGASVLDSIIPPSREE